VAASEARGERIGALRIVTSDVFDLRKPDENTGWREPPTFSTSPPRAHYPRGLLFKLGDRVDAATIHETERFCGRCLGSKTPPSSRYPLDRERAGRGARARWLEPEGEPQLNRAGTRPSGASASTK